MKKQMRRFAIAVAAMMLALTSAHAADLPDCNAQETRAVFANAVNHWNLLEFRNLNSDDPKKRWCYAYYVGRFGMRSPYMDAVFTLEWLNESQGRFWLQVREAGQSCRGTMYSPWSLERCPADIAEQFARPESKPTDELPPEKRPTCRDIAGGQTVCGWRNY
jgi:hypothetical protein